MELGREGTAVCLKSVHKLCWESEETHGSGCPRAGGGKGSWGGRVVSLFPGRKRIQVSAIQKINLPSNQRPPLLPPWMSNTWIPFAADLSSPYPSWAGRIMVSSVDLTTVSYRRMRLMKCGCFCFQLETLANSTTKGRGAEQKTCNVQNTRLKYMLSIRHSLQI